MTDDNRVRARVEQLDADGCKKVIQEALELMLDEVTLPVDNEESARELLAEVFSVRVPHASADDIMPPDNELGSYARRCLLIMADEPYTSNILEAALDNLPDERQMFVDPITGAVVLGAVIAFLQLKFSVNFKRTNGKTDLEFSLGKEAVSDETLGKVVDAITSLPGN